MSEPNAGSDVAGIQTTAKKDGDDYVINGSKTFITNGTRADFVTLLAKTRPGVGRPRVQLLPRADEDQGLPRREEAQEDRQPLERHRRAPLRGHAHPEALPPRRGEHGVHVPHAELPERAHHRLHERVRRAAAACSRRPSSTAATARRSASRSSSASTGSTSSSTSRRSSRPARALTYKRRRGLQRGQVRQEGQRLARHGEDSSRWRRSSSAT